ARSAEPPVIPGRAERRMEGRNLAMAGGLSRRDLVRLTALGLGSIALPLARLAPTVADSIYIEVFPTSPLVINPFSDPLPIPGALAPVPRSAVDAWAIRPGPGAGQQSAASGTH